MIASSPPPRTRLLLVFGGVSSEHEISLRSATNVLDALDRDRFEPVLLAIARDGSWRTGTVQTPLGDIVGGGQPVADLRALRPDLAFPVLHGPHGEDGTIQGLFEILGIPYVGAGVLASAVCMDKAVQKHVIQAAAPGIPVVPWVGLRPEDWREPRAATVDRIAEACGFPCFVKPANLGSSVGVVRVADAAELPAALDTAFQYDDSVVVERGVDAREIEIAVLGNGGPETQASEPGEIGLPPGVWYDYETKYIKDVATLHIPAQLDDHAAKTIREHALRAFRVTGCQGLARIDFLLDRGSGTAYLNELNTMPGFTAISMYPKLMEHAGVPYAALITRLCELALQAHAHRARLKVDL